jgi:catechol 2,3-dioxygenase-like lactoylglutathione lyase family enzyme
MKPELKYLSPILWTKDLEKTISFYTAVLGFTARSNFPDFASLARDRVEIMFVVPRNDPEGSDSSDPDSFFPKPHFTGSLYLTIQYVDELWINLKDKIEVISPLCDQEYKMRDFSIRDNNGYELVFGENIP